MARKTRTRIVYRTARAPSPIEVTGPVNVGSKFGSYATKAKEWTTLALFFGGVIWALVLPVARSQAEELLKSIGMDPATVQQLNKNLSTLEDKVKDLNNANEVNTRATADLTVKVERGLEDAKRSADDAKDATKDLSGEFKGLQQQNATILDLIKGLAQKQVAP